MRKNTIGITMGDPFGIGPEIIYRSWSEISSGLSSRLLIFGWSEIYEKLQIKVEQEFLELFYPLDLSAVEWLSEITQESEITPKECQLGGQMAFLFLQQSVAQVKSGLVQGLVNGPVSKKAIALSQPGFLGHTQFYEQQLCTSRAVMSFHGKSLNLSLLTHHIPLRDCSSVFMKEDVETLIRISVQGFSTFLGKSLRVAICGFNPHAGEGGLLSAGEDEKIRALVQKLRQEGFMIEGPIASDSLFVPEILSRYDLVFACNHDQGLIAFKSLHFYDGISITWGLEVPRMTVDHGTAYDLAGTGKASYESFKNAILGMERFLINCSV